MGLRTDRGVDLGKRELEILCGSPRFLDLLETGHLELSAHRLSLTRSGLALADALGVEISDLLEALVENGREGERGKGYLFASFVNDRYYCYVVASHVYCHAVGAIGGNFYLCFSCFARQLLPDRYCLVNTGSSCWVPPSDQSSGCVHRDLSFSGRVAFCNKISTLTGLGKTKGFCC